MKLVALLILSINIQNSTRFFFHKSLKGAIFFSIFMQMINICDCVKFFIQLTVHVLQNNQKISIEKKLEK